jgi:hypothetical protein
MSMEVIDYWPGSIFKGEGENAEGSASSQEELAPQNA